MDNKVSDQQIAENLLKKTFYLKKGGDGNNNFLTKFKIDGKIASKEIRKINQEIESNKTLFSKIVNKIKKPFSNIFGYIGAFFTGGFGGVILRKQKQKKKHIIHNAIRIQKGLKKANEIDNDNIGEENDKKEKKEKNDNNDKIIDDNKKNKFEQKEEDINNKDPLLNIGDSSFEKDEYEEEDIKPTRKNDNKLAIDNEKKRELPQKKTIDDIKINEVIKKEDVKKEDVKQENNSTKEESQINNQNRLTNNNIKENILKDAFNDKQQNKNYHNNDKQEEKNNNNSLLFSNLKESKMENINQKNYNLNNVAKPDKKKDNNLSI